MSESVHTKTYIPNYMLQQSLWNMEQQISQLRGMIKPETKTMAWQNHLASMAQRDIQHVHNSIAYSKYVHDGEGYGAPHVLSGHKPCPLYHVYLDRHRSLIGQAHRALGIRRSSLLQAAATQRRKAQIELSKCRVHHGHAYGGMTHHHSYGACGNPSGCPSCASGEYGGGCGAFARWSKKNAAKRACWLEKKIAKHQECCDRDCSFWSGKGNQSNQCRKIAEWEAELSAIQVAEYGPQTLETATDMEWQRQQQSYTQGGDILADEQAATQRTMIYLGAGALVALGLVVALR